MPILMRLLAAYTMLTALLLASKFIFDIARPDWPVVNWLMAAAILIVLITAFHGKRRADAAGYAEGESGVRRFLDANVPFYAAAALLIAFAFQWSDGLAGHEQLVVDGVELPYSGLWAYIDPLYVALVGAMSARMWSAAGRASREG